MHSTSALHKNVSGFVQFTLFKMPAAKLNWTCYTWDGTAMKVSCQYSEKRSSPQRGLMSVHYYLNCAVSALETYRVLLQKPKMLQNHITCLFHTRPNKIKGLSHESCPSSHARLIFNAHFWISFSTFSFSF